MQRILGLDIGSYSVKASLLHLYFKKFELQGFYELKYPHVSDEERDRQIFSTIQTLIKKSGVSFDQIIIAIPGDKALGKLLTLPFTDKKKIEQVLPFEIENFIPFTISDIAYDYQIIEKEKDHSKVFVSIVKKDYISHYLEELHGIGIEPKSVECDCTALTNLLSLDKEYHAKDTIGIIDLGHRKTTIIIASHGKILLGRSLLLGGHTITRALQKKLSISYEQAEELKHQKAQVRLEEETKPGDSVSEIVQPIVETLSGDIIQTIRSYEVNSRQKISQIYLCGGTYKLHNLPQYLSLILGIQCYPLKYLDGDYNKLTDIKGKASILGQSFALGLSSLSKTRNSTINFRKKDFSFKKSYNALKTVSRRYIGMATAIVILLIANSITQCIIQKERLAHLDKEIISLFNKTIPNSKEKVVPKKVTKIIKGHIDEAKKVVDSLDVGSISMLDSIKEISTHIPPDIIVDVTKLDISNGKVKMSGTTESIESVDRIIMSLSSFPNFRDVEKGSVSSGIGGQGMKFTISFTITTE